MSNATQNRQSALVMVYGGLFILLLAGIALLVLKTFPKPRLASTRRLSFSQIAAKTAHRLQPGRTVQHIYLDIQPKNLATTLVLYGQHGYVSTWLTGQLTGGSPAQPLQMTWILNDPSQGPSLSPAQITSHPPSDLLKAIHQTADHAPIPQATRFHVWSFATYKLVVYQSAGGTVAGLWQQRRFHVMMAPAVAHS